MLQADTIYRIIIALMLRFPNDFVKEGGFIMPNPEDGNDRFATDGYIAFGVTRERIAELELPNYWTWVVGKMPEFALEVASPSTKDRDLGFKRRRYAELRFREYFLLDPTGGDLYGKPIIGLHLVGDKFEEYEVHTEPDGSARVYSELLKLEFWWMSDGPEYDPFDLRDPVTGKSICVDYIIENERETRLAAELQARSDREISQAERERRQAAEREAQSERERRQAAELQAQADRDAREARDARLAAERRERELLRRLKRLQEPDD